MRGVSSWSTSCSKAYNFGNRDGVKVVFIEASTPKKQAVSVKALSANGFEDEALYPLQTKFRVEYAYAKYSDNYIYNSRLTVFIHLVEDNSDGQT
jgi:hypothetical protein